MVQSADLFRAGRHPENPDAAYSGLKNIFDRFTPTPSTTPSTGPNAQPNAPPQDSLNSLIEGIGSMLGPQKRPQPPQTRSNDQPQTPAEERPQTRSEERPQTPAEQRPPTRPEEPPQSPADDQERAREFLKNLFRN